MNIEDLMKSSNQERKKTVFRQTSKNRLIFINHRIISIYYGFINAMIEIIIAITDKITGILRSINFERFIFLYLS